MEGQANEAPKQTKPEQVQEQAPQQEEQVKLSVKDRLAQRFQKVETSQEETTEAGVENKEAGDSEPEGSEKAVNKYQVLLDNIYTVGEGEDAKELSGKELRDSLLRREDYTKKTTELAEKRKAIETQEKDFVETISFFDAANQAAIRQFQGVNWQALQQQDPAQYQSLLGQYQHLQRRNEQLLQVKNNFSNQVSERQIKLQEKAKQEFSENIKAYLPDWNDESLGEFKSLTELYDISEEEFSSSTDPRFFAMAKDAMAFRQAQSNVNKAIENKPTPAVPTRNSTGQFQKNQNASVRDRLKNRIGGKN